MKFRLTYEGRLLATNRDALSDAADRMALHKHHIRTKFHYQLKQFWATNRFLDETYVDPGAFAMARPENCEGHTEVMGRISLRHIVAEQNKSHGFRFLPLVVDKFDLLCSLDILFLRRDIPGSVISAGDIDNRIKTIIDALRPPKQENEFWGKDKQPIIPEADQDPFYVLLEDDKQVSHFSVETDRLLDPLPVNPEDHANVRLVISVELRPYHATMFNLSYV